MRLFRSMAAFGAALTLLASGAALAADQKPLVNYSGVVQPIKSTDTASVPALKVTGITGSTQCLQASSAGLVSGTGSACGSGGGGGGSGFTPPVASNYTLWVNQQSSAITDNTGSGGPLVISTTQNTSGDSVNARLMAVPSGSWTLIINATMLGHRGGVNNAEPLPVVLYDSSSSKLWTYGYIPGSSAVTLTQFSNSTSWNSGSNFTDSAFVPQMWYKVKYVSGSTPSMTFFLSLDGFTWLQTHTTTSLWITPTHFGFGVDTQGNPSGQVLALSLNSWVVTTP